MMIAVFDSLTGEGRKFAESLGLPTQSVRDRLDDDCILITRNTGMGQIPLTTKIFVKNNKDRIKGFVNNGNSRMHSLTFCGASSKLEKKYGLKLIRNIDQGGTAEDVEAVKQYISKLAKGRKAQHQFYNSSFQDPLRFPV